MSSGYKDHRLVLLQRIITRPGFWLLITLLAIITLHHYGDSKAIDGLSIGLEHDAFGRILYLIPIISAGFLFGYKGVLVASLAALACMLPHAAFISTSPRDAFLEAGAVFISGSLAAFAFSLLGAERARCRELNMLNQTVNVISQSLELNQILSDSIEKITEVMRVDIALVFLTDRETGSLVMAAHRGIDDTLAQGMHSIAPGDGLFGQVAEDGEPMVLAKASQDPNLARVIAPKTSMGSALMAALKSDGKVLGTLCVIARIPHHFTQHETHLLNTMADQIGIAVDKSYRYEQAWLVGEQLAASEERYRELFETANDAIWVHDLQGSIIAANRSMLELTGYTFAELRRIKANDLIANGCADEAKSIDDPLIKGAAMERLAELVLTKKDDSEAWVQFSTSPVLSNGQLVAFQHMARDVTKEKRMRENLRFYLHQITRAQEEERKRVARELHDETIQALSSLSFDLDRLSSASNDPSSNNSLALENLRERVNGMMEDVRRLSQDLRPATLDRLGLLPALEWLSADIEKRSGIDSQCKVHGRKRRLPADVELLLFRTAQEALRNSWRHSQASHIELIVEFEETAIKITIRDDGNGFDPALCIDELIKGGRLGLAGMYERVELLGGSLETESRPAEGTTVSIEVPIAP